ncbi:alpha/beta fold hydrolase [Maritimibacter sp. HL-12]|uniref:alpha/beta fold hydrolase n=1 Tax=Maritimibacter sp. HL-12 TaxID=1162418 RepID=UPI000A0EFE51|nr:alpha/beta fold hydrolase [Maritimibacter sp. HL-12]SMH49982.1 Pimeloyl-ACP methyl ester carboxylesterase [Maritimibacter sp. HL-12]
MARFLLVHGSGHGAWCWRDVRPALVALGHEADALDLPGSGDDSTPAGEVTLEGYGEAILARLDAPSIVVGHSAGGYAIARAAEIAPALISRLVYLCAYVPRPGVSLIEMRREAPEQPLAGALETSADRLSYRFTDAAVAANLCADCPPEALAFARRNLGWQPIAPQAEPFVATGKGAGIPRSYIVCEQDRTIPPAHQRSMAAGFAANDIFSLPTGHAPFLAAPGTLADLLDRIARG